MTPTITNADPRDWARVAKHYPDLDGNALAPDLFALFTTQPTPTINESGDTASVMLWAQAHPTYQQVRDAVAGDAAKGAIATRAFLAAATIQSAKMGDDYASAVAFEAADATDTKIDEYDEALTTLTSSMDGTPARAVPLDDRLRLAQTMARNPEFRKTVDLAGRFTRIVRNVRRATIPSGRENVKGATQGRRVSDLTAGGRALMAMEPTQPLFAVGFAKNTLPLVLRKGREQAGKGPIIYVYDVSSSMETSVEGIHPIMWLSYVKDHKLPEDAPFYSRMMWARATMIAFALVARDENRDMAVIAFSDSRSSYGEVDVNSSFATEELPGQRMTLGQILDAASLQPGSRGTQYKPAMREVLRIATKAKYRQADVVWASDGDPNDRPLETDIPEWIKDNSDPAVLKEFRDLLVFPDWQEARTEREMRVFSIYIGQKAPELQPNYADTSIYDPTIGRYVAAPEFYKNYPQRHPLYTLRTMSDSVIDLADMQDTRALQVAATI